MKILIRLSFLLILMASYTSTDPGKLFGKLSALEGMWVMQAGRITIGEEWTKISSERMQGRGFMVKGKDTITMEKIELCRQADEIFYIPAVGKQNNGQSVKFRLTSDGIQSFVFENPAHDFPRRIVYRFVTNDSIHAFIDGGPGDSGKREDFYFKKVR